MIDRLDSGDRHYDQKYQDMSDRLDNLYDRISDLDEEIAGVDARIQAAYEKQITELCSRLGESYPARMSLPQQGSFQLGYYHQTQARYQKKEENENV